MHLSAPLRLLTFIGQQGWKKLSKTFMFYLTVILLSAVRTKLRHKMIFRSLLYTVTEEDLKPSHKTKPQQL